MGVNNNYFILTFHCVFLRFDNTNGSKYHYSGAQKCPEHF